MEEAENIHHRIPSPVFYQENVCEKSDGDKDDSEKHGDETGCEKINGKENILCQGQDIQDGEREKILFGLVKGENSENEEIKCYMFQHPGTSVLDTWYLG